MPSDKKRDEKKPTVPGVPGGSLSAPPQLPEISLGGGLPQASGSWLFAGTAGKVILVTMVGAVGVGAVGLAKLLHPSDGSVRPVSFFAPKPSAAAASAAAAPSAAADGVEVVPPSDAARYDASGAQVNGGAGPVSADAAAAAAGQTGTVSAGETAVGPKGAGAAPAQAGSLSSRPGTLPMPAMNLKPSAATPAASGGGSSMASYTAPASAPARSAGVGRSKGMAATGASGARGSAIANSHSRGALRQLMLTAGSSRQGALATGEASAASAGMHFDNGSAIAGGGARPMGGAGTGQAPKPNAPHYDGGAPINTDQGGMPQAMPTAGHKDVTPWSKLAMAATFLLLGAALLLVTAQLLASYAKKHPTGLHSAALMTAAEWIAGAAGVMGLTAAGIGGKIVSMGGGIQGWMMVGGGLLTAGLAAYAVMSDRDDKADIEAKQQADADAAKDKLKGNYLSKKLSLDPTEGDAKPHLSGYNQGDYFKGDVAQQAPASPPKSLDLDVTKPDPSLSAPSTPQASQPSLQTPASAPSPSPSASPAPQAMPSPTPGPTPEVASAPAPASAAPAPEPAMAPSAAQAPVAPPAAPVQAPLAPPTAGPEAGFANLDAAENGLPTAGPPPGMQEVSPDKIDWSKVNNKGLRPPGT